MRVARGIKLPYYLALKRLRPEGFYVRSGLASVSASDTSILRMVQEAEGDAFAAQQSLRQDLTFENAREEEISQKGLSQGGGALRTLGAALADGTFTNLGLLLSD